MFLIRVKFSILYKNISRSYQAELLTKYMLAFLLFPLPVKVAHGGTVVEALCYKSEGRGINSRWCRWNFSLT
jgi:hypothetical protein